MAGRAVATDWSLLVAVSHNKVVDLMPALTTIEQSRLPIPIRVLNKCGASLEKFGLSPSSSASDLIETAKRRCGLDDFGSGDFFEPLAHLLESCQRDARLNVIGKIALRCDIVRTLGNRLLM